MMADLPPVPSLDEDNGDDDSDDGEVRPQQLTFGDATSQQQAHLTETSSSVAVAAAIPLPPHHTVAATLGGDESDDDVALADLAMLATPGVGAWVRVEDSNWQAAGVGLTPFSEVLALMASPSVGPMMLDD